MPVSAATSLEKTIDDLPDRPRLSFLSPEKIERIHQATLEILDDIGIQVTRGAAREMLAEAGCRVEKNIVHIPARLVEAAIEAAPKRITIYDRLGEPALALGSSAVYTMTGYTDLDFIDLESGCLRPYTLEDFRHVATVADALSNIDIIGHPGSVRPSASRDAAATNLLEVEAMLTHTSKPLHILVFSSRVLNTCFEMAQAVTRAQCGASLMEKPFVLPMLNPVSPLVFNEDTIDKLLLSVDWGVPVICGPMPMAGGTSPATLAGTIAQNNAESLAGLVIAQTRKPGAPYVMITFAVPLDMRTGDIALGPEATLLQMGAVELGQHYGIPVCGSWAGTGYKGFLDVECGWLQMLAALAGVVGTTNAGIGIGAGTSLESCVMADELMGMLKTMMKGIPVNEETLALDVLREVGPGGGKFMAHPHTLKHAADSWQPRLVPGSGTTDWETLKNRPIMDRARDRIRTLLQHHRPRPIPAAAREEIDAILRRAGVY